jgi:pyruvate formate lyase activating enzyme
VTEENVTPPAIEVNRPVPFVETLPDNKLRCRVCEYRCSLAPGEVGMCKVRQNQAGTLIATNYGVISRAGIERVEMRRFYHLLPGSRVFSIGGFGQNFPAISGDEQYDLPTEKALARPLPVDRLIKFCIERQCRGVIFAFNEPSIWYEYLQDAVQMVKANGMFAAIVTNGYFSKEILDTLGHYVAGMLVEVNAFNENTFKVLTGQNYFQKVLETTTLALRKHKIHVEIATRLIPGVNDNETELKTIATWIKQVLGPNIPWHISSPVPDARANLEQAKAIGKEVGVNYIYLETAEELASGLSGKPPDHRLSDDSTFGGDTYCHNCRHLVIERSQIETAHPGLNGNKCAYCGAEMGIHNSIWKL